MTGDVWLIYFEDKDMAPEVFVGEENSRRRFDQLRQNWSVHLFRLADAELCLCAAIRMPDGEVVRGHRHDNCYDVVRRRLEYILVADKDAVEAWRKAICDATQGFLTSRGRFVDRKEGMTLMRASGLPSHYSKDGTYNGDELFSEDLYPNGPINIGAG